MNRLPLLVFFFLLGMAVAGAQSNLGHDPVSRIGAGWEPESGLTRNVAMGSCGRAVPSPDHPNFLNPALLAFNRKVNLNLDLRYSYRTLIQGNSPQFSTGAGSPSFISMLFPLSSRLSVGAGVRPYSFRDFVYSSRQSIDGDSLATRIRGSGGSTQVFLAAGYQISSWLRVGLEGSYVMGTLEDSVRYGFLPQNANFAFLSLQKKRVSQFLYRPGFQAEIPAGKKGTRLAIGGTLDLVQSVGYKDYRYFSVTGARNPDTLNNGERQTTGRSPRYSLAIGLYRSLFWSVTGEIDWQPGAPDSGSETGYTPAASLSWRAGGEFSVGTARSTRYLNIMTFRLGVQQNTLPFTVEGKAITDRRISAGASFPIIRKEAKFSRPLINLGIAIGQRGRADLFTGRNRYVEVQLSFTMNDFLWFNRYRVD